jgi:DNA repair protein RecO (recombination protein O)
VDGKRLDNMSHHIYQTECFVVESRPSGEANKLIFLFTEDLGMVMAVAQGVRLLKSKLRYSLQDFSFAKVSLVRGKELWRITSAGSSTPILSKISPDSFVFARGLQLVKRLVQGEEKNENLWGVLKSAFLFIESREVDKVQPESFEFLFVLRILNSLGYISSTETIAGFVKDNDWSAPLLEEVTSSKKEVLAQINRALKESQL